VTSDRTDSVTSTYENRISKNGVATTYVYDADLDGHCDAVCIFNTVATIAAGIGRDGGVKPYAKSLAIGSVKGLGALAVQGGRLATAPNVANGYNAGFAGITSTFFNNSRLQPCRIAPGIGALPLTCADANHGSIFDIGYDFQLNNTDNGDVMAITNFKDAARSQSFTYDSVNRITSAQNAGTDCSITVGGGTKFWGNSYSFDEWGNLFNKTVTKCSSEYLNTTVDVNNRVHVSGADYQYDAAGNMTNDQTDSVTSIYDQENRISTATRNGITSTYAYDSDGNRVKKSSGSSGMLYWHMLPGIVAESDLSGNLTSEYVFFGGTRVARKDFPSNAIAYYFSDHLKTTSVITDSAGNTKSDSDYTPWGGELQFTSSDPNHYKFTGKERDGETQLDYFGARYYSNRLGRWVSADWSPTPIPLPYADLHDPQTLNLYGFVGGNPATNIDKDGHCLEDACLIETGVAVSFLVIASAQYLSLPSNQRSLAAAASYASSKISGWFHKSDNNSKPSASLAPAAPVGATPAPTTTPAAPTGTATPATPTAPAVPGTQTNQPRSNPMTGEPGSTSQTNKADGSPKQVRRYGSDGYPETDVDHDSHGGQNNPHAHDWGRPADGSAPNKRGQGPHRPAGNTQ
jgi:RHS repeat-associated protein